MVHLQGVVGFSVFTNFRIYLPLGRVFSYSLWSLYFVVVMLLGTKQYVGLVEQHVIPLFLFLCYKKDLIAAIVVITHRRNCPTFNLE